MRRRFTPLVLAAVLASAAAAGCSSTDSSSPKGQPASVTVSVTHPEDLYGLPWKVGQEQGFFEKAGIKVAKVVPSEGGGTTLQNVVAGKLPFGEVATGAVVKGAKSGAPVQAIGGGIQSVFDVLWVVDGTKSKITDVKQASSARWGFTNPGSVSQAISYLVPAGAGVTGNVQRTATGGTGAGIALLGAGDVDVAYASPRVVAEKGSALRVIAHSDTYVPQYQQTLIISSRNYAEKNPDQAKALLKGYADAIDWIEKNPDAAADLWAKGGDIDSATARQIVNDAVKAHHWSVAFDPKALDAAANGLKATDGFDSVDWKDLLTDKYLPSDHKGQIPS